MPERTDQDNIDSIILWMVGGLSREALQKACVERLGLKVAQAKKLMAEARRRLILAAKFNRDEQFGVALKRLNDLYARCMRINPETRRETSLAGALEIQKEINRLVGLYHHPTAGLSTHGEAEEELKAVAEHLLGLGLVGPEYPLREHARVAAQRIRELEARCGVSATSWHWGAPEEGENQAGRRPEVIYTLGYSGWTVEQVVDVVNRLGALLVDVRYRRSSRRPGFGGRQLAERLGGSYCWIRQWGNKNYRSGPVELVDFEAGVRLLAEQVAGRPVILMCACADVERCHRKVVAERLAAHTGARVIHLGGPGDFQGAEGLS